MASRPPARRRLDGVPSPSTPSTRPLPSTLPARVADSRTAHESSTPHHRVLHDLGRLRRGYKGSASGAGGEASAPRTHLSTDLPSKHNLLHKAAPAQPTHR